MSRRRKVPSYRLHKPSGQAVVTLSGRDLYLGRHGTEASREAYDRAIAEWLANGRCWPSAQDEIPALTVADLILRYWEHCLRYYGDGSEKLTPELYHQRKVLRVVRRLYGSEMAKDFGPRALKACRTKFVEDGHVRRSVNQLTQRITRMFQWAAEEELAPASVYHALKAVRGLRRGRTEAKEGKKVRPVPQEHIDAVLEVVSATVGAMIQVQVLTGMRPGELCSMRGLDIDQSVDPWIYRPQHHKTEHHGHDRMVYLGPKAQAILAPLLEVAGAGQVFSPKRSEEARQARRKLRRRSKITPSQAKRKRKAKPKRAWRDHYDKDSYRRAITRACESAGIPKWTPHQLRHSAATELRRVLGLDAARTVLGHRSGAVTEIYAELDRSKASDAMARFG